MRLLRLIDLPPVWLLGGICIVWAMDRALPWGLFGAFGAVSGAALVAVGLGLLGLAAGQMILARTTVIPRHTPSKLVTTGCFRWSRNPIYLADALILSGAILWWDVPLALPLIYGFMQLIQKRFILPEEAVLRAGFGEEFTKYAAQTRRWFGLA